MNIFEPMKIECEYYTEELIPRQNELLRLKSDEKLRNSFIKKINLNDYTNENLVKLVKRYNKANKRNSSLINQIFFEDLLNAQESYTLYCRSRIFDFEKNLAYLICLDFMSIEEALSRGFNEKYLEDLLKDYKKILEDPYEHYFTYPNMEKREKIKVRM